MQQKSSQPAYLQKEPSIDSVPSIHLCIFTLQFLVAGVQKLFKEMVGTVLENGLEGELEEELGYSKYDYRNKVTDNSRNGYSEKTLKSSVTL